MKFIDILESPFHGNSFVFALKIDDVADAFRGFVHVPDKADDSLRLMVFDLLGLILALVLKENGQLGI